MSEAVEGGLDERADLDEVGVEFPNVTSLC